jgi:hypothetical protein
VPCGNRIVPTLDNALPLKRTITEVLYLDCNGSSSDHGMHAKGDRYRKLVDARAGSSMTGMPNTLCTHRYSDDRGDQQVEKIQAKDTKCPSTIENER